METLSARPGDRNLQSRHCFVCGSDNPRGLKVPFYFDGHRVSAQFAADESLCGFDGIVHGGILFSLCDEAMMHLDWASDLRAITAGVTIRFHDYVRINEPVEVSTFFEEKASRLTKAGSEIRDLLGKRKISASGKFLPIKPYRAQIFRKQI